MQLVPLTPDYPLATFDCGDEDLNKFFAEQSGRAERLLSRQGGIFHLTYSIK
jgi:hypothetical protein